MLSKRQRSPITTSRRGGLLFALLLVLVLALPLGPGAPTALAIGPVAGPERPPTPPSLNVAARSSASLKPKLN